MPNRRRQIVAVLGVAALTATALVSAQDRMPKLPKAHALQQGGDSPAPVIFNHESHVDAARPVCGTCHPKLFKILEPGKTRDGKRITHDMMNRGAACGACHSKTSFGFDDCSMCHKSP